MMEKVGKKFKLLCNGITNFVKKNKILSGILLVAIVLLIFILAIKSNTYAVNDSDYVNIACPETANAGEFVSCTVSVNIASDDVRGFQANITYDDGITFASFERDKSCTEDNGCYNSKFDSPLGGPNAILFYRDGTGKGLYTIGTLKYKMPDTAKGGDEYSITFSDIVMANTNTEDVYKPENIVKKIRIPSDDNNIKGITLSSGNINEQISNDNTVYTANVDADTVNITIEKSNQYATVEGELENISLHYGTNDILFKVISETNIEKEYTIRIYRPYTFNTDVYNYDKVNNTMYTKSDVDDQVIKTNLKLSKELSGDVIDNKLIISYDNEKLTEVNLINITNKKYSLSNSIAYIGKNVDYSTFMDNLVLNGDISVRIFDNSGNEITSGKLTKDHKMKVYYNGNSIEEYSFSEEYLNIKLNVDEKNNDITKISLGTTVTDLLSKIETSGSINIKDGKSGEPITNDSKIKTGDIIEINMTDKTNTYRASVLGDVSDDGEIDIRDIALVYRYVKNKNRDQFKSYHISAADVTGDGQIKINDVGILYRYMKGKITTLEEKK